MSKKDQELSAVARHTDDTVANLSPVGSADHVDSANGGRRRDDDLSGGAYGADSVDRPFFDGDAATAEHVDLSTDPFDDNLADELAARQPRRLTSRTTLILGGAVLIVGGFLGGVLVQKNFGTVAGSGTNTAANARAGFGGAGGLGGAGGGAAGGGTAGGGTAAGGQTGGGQAGASRTATTGTVKLVDGTTVYITTAAGDVITVKTSSSTAVQLQQAATLKDLAAGATVTIQGTTGADGTITATQVTGQK